MYCKTSVREGGILILSNIIYWEKREILGKVLKNLYTYTGGLGNNSPNPLCVKQIPVKNILFLTNHVTVRGMRLLGGPHRRPAVSSSGRLPPLVLIYY